MESRGAMLLALTRQESCERSVSLHARTGTGLAFNHDAPAGTHPLWVQGLKLLVTVKRGKVGEMHSPAHFLHFSIFLTLSL